MPTEQAAFLALLLDEKAVWHDVADSVEELGSALAVLESRLAESLFERDVSSSSLARAETQIEEWRQEGIHFATLLDEAYPSQIRSIHQRPPFVTWRGAQSIRDRRSVAVVGTRHPSERGVALASDVARGLAGRGVTVVSGLARGIDTAAHASALAAGGRTVAVIGTGLRRSYPAENRGLQERISSDGMVLSQFLPDAAPSKASFPMRNATMSGFASATVVIEAADRSGARMQARLALEHGRPVFLHESLMEHEWALTQSRRSGVRVFASVDDVLQPLDEHSQTITELVWD